MDAPQCVPLCTFRLYALLNVYMLLYLQTVCFTECFITQITAIWTLPLCVHVIVPSDCMLY